MQKERKLQKKLSHTISYRYEIEEFGSGTWESLTLIKPSSEDPGKPGEPDKPNKPNKPNIPVNPSTGDLPLEVNLALLVLALSALYILGFRKKQVKD